MVGERARRLVDRKPLIRRAEQVVDDTAHNARNAPGSRLRSRFPPLENRNVGGGIAVGALEAAVAIVLKDTLGVPFGSDIEISDVQPADRGNIYTVNVDAPFENMARAEAFFEAQTGFTSLLTDQIDVSEVEVLRKRPLRDTYQIKIRVED